MELWESLIRTVSALAVVLGLMGLLIVIVRRLNLKGVLEPTRAPVRILGSGYVGPRKSVMLISVAGEYLIIGATADDLVPLGRVQDPQQIERLLGNTPVAAASTMPPTVLSRISQWLRGPQATATEGLGS